MPSTVPVQLGMSDAVGPVPQVTAFPAVTSFTIASLPMPGRWTLTSADKEFGWQIQQGYGLSGAYVFPIGDKLVVPKFKGEFWSHSDFAIYKEIRKQIFQKGMISMGGFVAAALGISHPELKALGVTSVVCLKVGPAIDAGAGLWTVNVDFLQYRAPIKALPKPKFAVPDASPPVPSPQDRLEVEIQALRGQAAALLGK